MTLTPDHFGEFFRAVNRHRDPFGWQKDLLSMLLEQGQWPGRIAAPTGSGKTSAIDVHVFAIALSTQNGGPRLPRRLAMVVDRRVLVDDQYERARDLARMLNAALDSAEEPVLREVAHVLASLHRPSLENDQDVRTPPPLVTARLRGGSVPSRSWRDYPASCAVLCATPDMWGSRLLFRGYGTADRAAAREAGLLAFDSAVLIDEAHLSRQLLVTAEQVSRLATAAERPLSGVPPLQVVAVSATPGSGPSERTVVAVDGAHLDMDEELGRRLTSPKPVRLVSVPDWPHGRQSRKDVEAAARAVMEMRAALEKSGSRHPTVDADGEPAATIGCFVNTVAMALGVASKLREDGQRVVTVCGQIRPADLDRLRDEHPTLLTPTGSGEVDVLVTTQSLEVGVDLDLAGVVTELASGTALAQRAGRVNRFGKRAYGDASAVTVLVPSGKLPENKDVQSGPYSAIELNAALNWVNALAETQLGIAPWAVHLSALPEAHRRRTLFQRPELADAWHWARTSDELAAEPELDLWLSDSFDEETTVGIVVRDAMPVDPADALEFVRTMPPERREVFPVPFKTALSVLNELKPGDQLDELKPANQRFASVPVRVRGEEITALRWRDSGNPDVRPGDVVVIDSAREVATSWKEDVFSPPVIVAAADAASPSSRFAAMDVLHYFPGADSASSDDGDRYRGQLALRIEWSEDDGEENKKIAGFPQDVARSIVAEFAASHEERPESDRRRGLADLLSAIPDGEISEICGLVKAVISLLKESPKDSDVFLQPAESPVRILVLDRRRTLAEEDRQLFAGHGHEVLLASHQNAVGERAAWLAGDRTLALPKDLLYALRVAGLHHDDGKADERFQKHVLGRLGDGDLLAKSRSQTIREMRARKAKAKGALPDRWRHEQRSVVDAWETVYEEIADPESGDPELALRLIGTSHGHGRSGFPHMTKGLASVDDDADWLDRARDLFDLGGWDDLIERTNLRYGVWGCAYLEAVLRAADCQVSEEGQ